LRSESEKIKSRVINFRKTNDSNYLSPDIIYVCVENSYMLNNLDLEKEWIVLKVLCGPRPYKIGSWILEFEFDGLGFYKKKQ